jgi:hypothetical protein
VFLPLNIDMGPRSPWGGEIHRGYIQSWNATLERQLPWSMVGSAGYVATRTIHQLIDRNINTVGPGVGVTTANLPLAIAYGRTIAMSMWDGIGISNYHSLQASLNKSFTHGLMTKVNYTFGKSLSMADEDGWVGLPYYNLPERIYDNYAPSGYDRAHMFSAGWNYELPIGKGKRMAIANKTTDLLIGGWKLSGVFVAYTGTPFTVSGSGSSLQATGNSQTADLIGPVTKIGGKGPGQFYYSPLSFIDPQISSIHRSTSPRPAFTGLGRRAAMCSADPDTGSSIRRSTKTLNSRRGSTLSSELKPPTLRIRQSGTIPTQVPPVSGATPMDR